MSIKEEDFDDDGDVDNNDDSDNDENDSFYGYDASIKDGGGEKGARRESKGRREGRMKGKRKDRSDGDGYGGSSSVAGPSGRVLL